MKLVSIVAKAKSENGLILICFKKGMFLLDLHCLTLVGWLNTAGLPLLLPNLNLAPAILIGPSYSRRFIICPLVQNLNCNGAY